MKSFIIPVIIFFFPNVALSETYSFRLPSGIIIHFTTNGSIPLQAAFENPDVNVDIHLTFENEQQEQSYSSQADGGLSQAVDEFYHSLPTVITLAVASGQNVVIKPANSGQSGIIVPSDPGQNDLILLVASGHGVAIVPDASDQSGATVPGASGQGRVIVSDASGLSGVVVPGSSSQGGVIVPGASGYAASGCGYSVPTTGIKPSTAGSRTHCYFEGCTMQFHPTSRNWHCKKYHGEAYEAYRVLSKRGILCPICKVAFLGFCVFLSHFVRQHPDGKLPLNTDKL